jgi:uracil-DNA glycosylase
MYKELADDTGFVPPNHGELVPWAKQGVLMLNAVLTVREGQANSHKGIGWENFTDRVIELVNMRERPVVFLLWGGNARSKKPLIDKTKHLILECAHPSPLSAYNGFFGCGHFKKTNEYLLSHGKTPIDWSAL